MTLVEEEAYVELRWIHPALLCMRGAGFKVLPTMTKRSMIHASYLFTVHREEEIVNVKQEIEIMETIRGTLTPHGWSIVKRIIHARKAVLAEIRQGMKEQG